jgi:hypothetical protein
MSDKHKASKHQALLQLSAYYNINQLLEGLVEDANVHTVGEFATCTSACLFRIQCA